MALIIAFVVVLFDNMLSDLIEAVKVGPFFYWIIALLIIQDLKNNKKIIDKEIQFEYLMQSLFPSDHHFVIIFLCCKVTLHEFQ
jgi:hypothetical protein